MEYTREREKEGEEGREGERGEKEAGGTSSARGKRDIALSSNYKYVMHLLLSCH